MNNRIIQILAVCVISAGPAYASRCPKGTRFDKNKLRCVPVKLRKKSRNYASLRNASSKKSIINPTLPKISDYPNELRKYILRGNTFFKKKLYLRAAGMYQKIPEEKKKETLFLIWGRALVLAGEFNRAVPVYENLIINYPDLKAKKEIRTYYNKLSDIAMQEKSCREGFIEDCRKLVKTYKNSCDKSPANQCFLWALGMEGLKSYNLAGEQFKKLCNQNFAHGCFAMGELLFHGLGVDKEPSRALVFFKKSCRLNLQKGCKRFSAIEKAKKKAQQKKAQAIEKDLQSESKETEDKEKIAKLDAESTDDNKEKRPYPPYEKSLKGIMFEVSVGINSEVGKDLYADSGVSYCNQEGDELIMDHCAPASGFILSGLMKLNKYFYLGGNIHYGGFLQQEKQEENFLLSINLEGRFYQWASDNLGIYALGGVGNLNRKIDDREEGYSDDTYMNAFNISLGGGISYKLQFVSLGLQFKMYQPIWIDNCIKPGNGTRYCSEKGEFRHVFLGVTASFYLPL
ncbi:MAG: hypothetical protein ACQES9_09270 [Myxococcota bacterium]